MPVTHDPKQKDLAERLGVSLRTVSLALNNRSGVAQNTRAQIQAEAERLGVQARGRRKHATIGVCVPDLISLNPSEWGNFVIENAIKEGYAVVIQPTNNADEQRRAADMFRKLGVEGVILTSSRVGSEFTGKMKEEGIPVVSWATKTSSNIEASGEAPCIVVDHYEGAYQAVRHLVAECGRRRVVCLRGPASSTSAEAKVMGYRAALAEAGLHPAPESASVVDPGSYDFQGGYEQMEKLWARGEKPDAIFCYSDELALGALRYCHIRGIHVPADLAICGYDDIRIAEYSDPPLTTVAVPRKAFAELAVRIIAEKLYMVQQTPFLLPGPDNRPYLRYRSTTALR